MAGSGTGFRLTEWRAGSARARTRRTNVRKSLIALSLCSMLYAGTSWSQQQHLVRTELDVTSFGLVTLAAGQTIRLSVVRAGIADPRLPPDPCAVAQDPRLPPDPCVVRMVVRNSAGAVIASSSEALAP